jgi:hypothetical protein
VKHHFWLMNFFEELYMLIVMRMTFFEIAHDFKNGEFLVCVRDFFLKTPKKMRLELLAPPKTRVFGVPLAPQNPVLGCEHQSCC